MSPAGAAAHTAEEGAGGDDLTAKGPKIEEGEEAHETGEGAGGLASLPVVAAPPTIFQFNKDGNLVKQQVVQLSTNTSRPAPPKSITVATLSGKGQETAEEAGGYANLNLLQQWQVVADSEAHKTGERDNDPSMRLSFDHYGKLVKQTGDPVLKLIPNPSLSEITLGKS